MLELRSRSIRAAFLLVSLLAMAALWSGAPASAAELPGKLVPGSKMKGAGAFMGPVRTVPANGIRIGYRQFGSGPDLLMISGDTAPMTLWMPYLLQPLARHFTVTIFDNRGVAYSTDDLSKRLTVPLMARDTAALIEALGLQKPTVLGWSMGGEIGLTLTEQNPELVGALITTGGDGGSVHTKQPGRGVIRKLAHPPGPDFLLRALFPSTAAGGRAAERFGRAFVSLRQEKVSQRTLDRQERAEEDFATYPKTWAGLGEIATPVLITNGALDRLNPVVNAHRLHSQIPGSKLSIYAGAGHGMLYQDSDRFVAEVVEFAAAAAG